MVTVLLDSVSWPPGLRPSLINTVEGTRGVLINTVRYARAVLKDLTLYFGDNSSSSDFGTHFWRVKGIGKRTRETSRYTQDVSWCFPFWLYLEIILGQPLGTLEGLTTATLTARGGQYVSFCWALWRGTETKFCRHLYGPNNGAYWLQRPVIRAVLVTLPGDWERSPGRPPLRAVVS